MLEKQDHHQNEKRQQQILHGAEVPDAAAAAEGIDAYGNQAQADGHNHRTGDNGGEKFPQGLQEKAQHRFKQAADDGRAHDGTIGQHTAAHGCGNAVEHADKAGGGAHDNGNPAANGADGKQLHQRHQARHQHGVLKQAQLQLREFAPRDAAGAGDDQQRGQVAYKHGQHVLQAQGDGLTQGHFSVQPERLFGEPVRFLHVRSLYLQFFYIPSIPSARPAVN